ncbi:methionyl-tRNA formyltransferase [Salinimicrobium xinjiangense]|uniref:methionyl-tRNA formyltransferase n=1 Tax=Salinimicrobium xinjiangense TaxID=438596 RepID=UPI00041D3B4E|nr:formyltransferase family protein [Salinimicrobium xinjiangense]
MSLTLYLLNKKGFEVLKALVTKEEYIVHIDVVVGGEDMGNQEDYYDEIKELCEHHSIRHIERGGKLPVQSEYSIAIGWRWLIKEPLNLIVIHDSYLPKYRGFSPIVNMLIKGEDHLGVTALWASERMDEGDIISQKKIDINYPLKIRTAIDLIAGLYVDIVLNIVELLINKKELNSTPQDPEQATYSIWRNEEDYFINWTDEAADIVRFVDAVGYPFDGAKTRTEDDQVIRILECEVVDKVVSEIEAPGKMLMFERNNPVILCGKNAVRLIEMEDLNGNPCHFKKFRTRLR